MCVLALVCQSVISLSCSADLLLFLKVITALTFYATQAHLSIYASLQYSVLHSSIGHEKSLMSCDVSIAHSTKLWRSKLFQLLAPCLFLPPAPCLSISWHWWHLGRIMGKCHSSRIIVYLLCSPHLTSPRLSSGSHLTAQPTLRWYHSDQLFMYWNAFSFLIFHYKQLHFFLYFKWFYLLSFFISFWLQT